MEACFSCLLLFAGPLPLALLAARSVRGGHRDGETALALLTALVVWCSLQACLGMALGASGLLTRPALLAAELTLAAVGVLALARSARQGPSHGAAAPARRPGAFTALIGAAGLACLAVLAALTLSSPVIDYDSLFYHLPAMARWYQLGALVPYAQFQGEQIGAYPYAWEVVCSLFLFPLGDDTLVSAPNLAAWAIFGLSVHQLALESGARPPAAAAFALTALGTPLAAQQVCSLHVDLPMAAFFLAGLVFLARFARSGRGEQLALLACCAGLLVGVKMSGLIYAAPLVGLFLLTLALRRRCAPPGRAIVPAAGPLPPLALLALASLGLVGSSWYLWNLSSLGNPLGHLEVKLGGLVIFPGVIHAEDVRRTSLAAIFDFTSRNDLRVLTEVLLRGLGPVFLLAVASCASLPAVLWRRADEDRVVVRVLGALTLLALLLYWLTPYGADTPNGMNGWKITAWMAEGLRYALPAVGLLAVVGARCASAWPLPDAWFTVLAAAGATGLAARRPVVFAGAFAVAAVFLQAAAKGRLQVPGRRGWALRTGLATACLATLLLLGSLARSAREAARAEHYGAIAAEIEALPAGTTVGYVLCERSYLLFGRMLDRRVVFVPLAGGDASAYAEKVRHAGADVLAVGPLVGAFAGRAEARWFVEETPPFERLSHGDIAREIVLFRVASPERGG